MHFQDSCTQDRLECMIKQVSVSEGGFTVDLHGGKGITPVSELLTYSSEVGRISKLYALWHSLHVPMGSWGTCLFPLVGNSLAKDEGQVP